MEMKDQIRIAREAAGLSQVELAGKLGLSRQSVVWWEEGSHRPKTGRIRELEEALNVRFDLAERGSAQPLDGKKNSLSVDPEILRLAVAIGRLPRRQRDAISTLAFIGEAKALNVPVAPEENETPAPNAQAISPDRGKTKIKEFTKIEQRGNIDGQRIVEVGSSTKPSKRKLSNAS